MTADREKLQSAAGYTFKDTDLLKTAMTHSSYANEHRQDGMPDNERLEFLGDAVLELISSEILFKTYPDMPEGDMTKLRASLVCEPALAFCARELGLPEYIMLGKGEAMTGGRTRDSIISDALEALIGAIYLDGGLESAGTFIKHHVMNDIEHKKLFYDSKTILQELVQKHLGGQEIRYELVKEEGPDHARVFTFDLYLGGKKVSEGVGGTKKGAQQQAAYKAIVALHKDSEGSICI